MKKCARSVVAVLILLSLTTRGSAQSTSVWKYMSRPDVTVGITGYDANAKGFAQPDIDYDSHNGYAHYGLMANFNIPFYELSQAAAFGFMPGLSLGISPQESSELLGDAPQSADLSLPWFVTFKYNNDATWKGGEGFQIGAAAGIGYSYHFFAAWGGYDNSHDFGNPVWMAELNFGERHSSIGVLKIRYIAAIGKGFSSSTPSGVQSPPFNTEAIDEMGGVYIGIALNY